MTWFIGAVDSIGMRDETRRRGVAVQPHAPFELEDGRRPTRAIRWITMKCLRASTPATFASFGWRLEP